MADRIQSQRPANESQRSEKQSLATGDNQNQQAMMRYEPYAGLPSPFDLVRRFTEDVDRLLSTFGMSSFGSTGNTSGLSRPFDTTNRALARPATSGGTSIATWAPSVEVTTRGDDLVVSAELPGIKPDEVRVEVEGNNLVIRGETQAEKENKDGGFWYSERVYGYFYRSIPLPPGANADNARAEFRNGMLEVTLPGAAKSVQPQRRPIQIQSEQQPGQQPQKSQQPQQAQQAQQSQQSQGAQTAGNS